MQMAGRLREGLIQSQRMEGGAVRFVESVWFRERGEGGRTSTPPAAGLAGRVESESRNALECQLGGAVDALNMVIPRSTEIESTILLSWSEPSFTNRVPPSINPIIP